MRVQQQPIDRTRPARRRLRAALVAGLAAGNLLLAACGAGQIAETAEKDPSIQGVNLSSDNGEYAVRGLLLAYPGVGGYPAGGDAPLHAVLYNDSKSPVTVTVTSEDAREVVLVATNRDLPATSTPDRTPASGSPGPGGPTVGSRQPARIDLPPLGFVRFNEQSGRSFALLGLDESLRSGQNATVTFDFGNGQRITGPAPVAASLTPIAPPPAVVEPEEAGIHEGG
ncbi:MULTISPECIES: hypothetical protein [unclassified Micromonospora]|uniref:hypothetical protein n=1 Tax=unclassified Micromonospora TaxID=2617518 RepID=UPI001C212B1F|nr:MULTISPECIES: hypothetical protein [unclassified Micromonospora]MBU8861648.1 hypothetical protein [Micromonospora sp. WMMB482]MDM4781217.1 hypothetical protein [Micromonospora sp. b486]